MIHKFEIKVQVLLKQVNDIDNKNGTGFWRKFATKEALKVEAA